MKKLISLILTALLVTGTLSGCLTSQDSQDAQNTRDTENTTTVDSPSSAETENTDTGTTTPQDNPDVGVPAGDPFRSQIQIGDDVYQFPMTFEQFLSFGWEFEEDITGILDSNDIDFGTGTSSDLDADILFKNFDINQRPMNECYVIGISLSDYQVTNNNVKILLPSGITFGTSTLEDVKATYGEPSNEYSYDDTSETLFYYDETYNISLSLGFDAPDFNLVYVDISNHIVPEDFKPSAVSTETPAIVDDYQEPTKINDDFGDWTFEYGGAFYTLPAPVSEFVKNGWTIDSEDAEKNISGNGYDIISLSLDNQKLSVSIENYSANATSVSNCFVMNVSADNSRIKIPLTIARGITVGMSEEELLAKISDVEYTTDEIGTTLYYGIEPVKGSYDEYMIAVDTETGLISSIQLSYRPSLEDYTS